MAHSSDDVTHLPTGGAHPGAERALPIWSAFDSSMMHLVVEHTPAAVAVVDAEMRYRLVSRRWLSDYRLAPADVIGRSHYDLFPDIPERWRAAHRRALKGEVVAADDDRFERADGRVDWVRWELHPWYQSDGAVGGLVIFTEVITARKELEASLQRLSTAVHRMADPMMLIDQDNRVVEANEAANRLFGWARGQTITDSGGGPAPDGGWTGFCELLARARAGERLDTMELDLPNLSGALVPVRMTISAVSETVTAGGDVAVVARDVSDMNRSRAALFSLTQRMAENRQSESLATFSLGMAHDLNNLLTAIQGSAEQLVHDLTAASASHRAARRILEAGNRASGLARELLTISQPRRPHLSRLDLRDAASSVQRLVDEREGGLCCVRLVIPDDPVLVRADTALMDEILARVVANAIDAMPDGGDLTIGLTTVTLDPAAAVEAALARGPYAQLSITDTGRGMPASVCARAFDPMFTTKPRGRGTGLSLAVVRSMVTSMDGQIGMRSEVGRGTTVTVLLPLASVDAVTGTR